MIESFSFGQRSEWDQEEWDDDVEEQASQDKPYESVNGCKILYQSDWLNTGFVFFVDQLLNRSGDTV